MSAHPAQARGRRSRGDLGPRVVGGLSAEPEVVADALDHALPVVEQVVVADEAAAVRRGWRARCSSIMFSQAATPWPSWSRRL